MIQKTLRQFAVAFLFLAVFPFLILSFLTYREIRDYAEEDFSNSLLYDLNKVQRTMEEKYATFETYAKIVCQSTGYYAILSDMANKLRAGDPVGAQYAGFYDFNSKFSPLVAADSDLTGALVLVDGRCVYSYQDFISISSVLTDQSLLSEIHSASNLCWLPSQNAPFACFKGLYAIVALDVRGVFVGNPSQSVCQFLMLIPQNRLDGLLRSDTRYANSVLSVFDAQGRVIAANTKDPEALETARSYADRLTQDKPSLLDTSGDYRVCAALSSHPDWRTVLYVPAGHLSKMSRSIILLTLIISAGLLSLLVLCAYVVKSQAKKERQRAQYEISMLKYQINPHFLYNTLNSIRFFAISQGDETTADMLVTLSRLLRNTLRNAGSPIRLEQELSNVKDYLHLQNARYQQKIRTEFQIAEGTKGLLVPGMILQPIVENAICHGLSAKLNLGEYASVRIEASLKLGKLLLSIQDNGAGMEQDQISNLLIPSLDKPDSHIGIYNIHKRIRLLYGDAYGLQIESKSGKYTLVHILLPAEGEDKNA